jgi:hypothetical protein
MGKKSRKKQPPTDETSEAIFELPNHEAMSLLPSGLGSLSDGLGGGLLGSSGTPDAGSTTPTAAPSPPPLATPTLPHVPVDQGDLSGASQTAPIAQQSSGT